VCSLARRPGVRTFLRVRFLPPVESVAGRDTAKLRSRVLAHFLDWSLQSAVQFFFAVVLAWDELLALAGDLASLSSSADPAAAIVEAVEDVIAGPLLLSVLIAWLIGGVLEVLLTLRFGGSLGKMFLGLEVVESDSGRRPGWRRVAARWFGLGWAAPAGLVSPVAQFVPFAGYALAWFDPQRRALHDRLSGIAVVRKHRMSVLGDLPPPSPIDAFPHQKSSNA